MYGKQGHISLLTCSDVCYTTRLQMWLLMTSMCREGKQHTPLDHLMLQQRTHPVLLRKFVVWSMVGDNRLHAHGLVCQLRQLGVGRFESQYLDGCWEGGHIFLGLNIFCQYASLCFT